MRRMCTVCMAIIAIQGLLACGGGDANGKGPDPVVPEKEEPKKPGFAQAKSCYSDCIAQMPDGGAMYCSQVCQLDSTN
jgi:hypothetical protein